MSLVKRTDVAFDVLNRFNRDCHCTRLRNPINCTRTNELMQIENGKYKHLYEMQFHKQETAV
jgi:hypothetical protein